MRPAAPRVLLSSNKTKPAMPRIAGPLLACMFALAGSPANAQAGPTPTQAAQFAADVLPIITEVQPRREALH